MVENPVTSSLTICPEVAVESGWGKTVVILLLGVSFKESDVKAYLQRKGVLLCVCEIGVSLITTTSESVQNNLKMEKDDYEVHL